ncbi:interferon a3-like [Aulostomus maculatus]
MLGYICVAVLHLGLMVAGSPLGCRWIEEQKFTQYNAESIKILDQMVYNNPSTAAAEVAFPNMLYSQASTASDEERLWFVVQILEGVSDLFLEDQTWASWKETSSDHFLSIIDKQADALRSCLGSPRTNNMLHVYFKRLSRNILQQMGYSADAWELIRREVKLHLFRAKQLIHGVH